MSTTIAMDKAQRGCAFSRLMVLVLLALLARGPVVWGQDSAPGATVTIDTSASGRMQVIDGFGTCIGNEWGKEAWFQQLYYDDLGCSMMRMDLTPRFVGPYSELNYYSPWFMGSGTKSVFNIEDKANPGGPEKNRVRTYTGPKDYSRPFGGMRAPIAVMGPTIERNIQLFDFGKVEAQGKMAQAGQSRRAKLGDFKLYGSIWSPAPWVKVSSGHKIDGQSWPRPENGTPWPFIWAGNFSGGKLDVSDTPVDVFNDGTGPTSALTQFARGTAAYVKGFQDKYGVRFYAISIQNEVNFEEFYNSATYPLSSQYITALKAVRREFDKYEDLKPILIIGPEDLLGTDAWGMWQLGGGEKVTHKNLQYLQSLGADAEANRALAFFCIHGYAGDGATSAGSDSRQWSWWVSGWKEAPARGLPETVKGFADYGKRSWMTETSGESAEWIAPKHGLPLNGAWGIAFKTQQALTAGRESALLYWQFAEKEDATTGSCLTRKNQGDMEPKFVAAKHFFKYIRPNAVAVKTAVAGADAASVTASAYVHDKDKTLTVVLVNRSAAAARAGVKLPDGFAVVDAVQVFSSSEKGLWKSASVRASGGMVVVPVPGYGVVTVYGERQ